jgi:hypothetical protein
VVAEEAMQKLGGVSFADGGGMGDDGTDFAEGGIARRSPAMTTSSPSM